MKKNHRYLTCMSYLSINIKFVVHDVSIKIELKAAHSFFYTFILISLQEWTSTFILFSSDLMKIWCLLGIKRSITENPSKPKVEIYEHLVQVQLLWCLIHSETKKSIYHYHIQVNLSDFIEKHEVKVRYSSRLTSGSKAHSIIWS